MAPPIRRRRPAGTTRDGGQAVEEAWGRWTAEELGERPYSEKKIRRVRREATGTESGDSSHPLDPGDNSV